MRALAILALSSALLVGCASGGSRSLTLTAGITETRVATTAEATSTPTPVAAETAEAIASVAAAYDATTTAWDAGIERAIGACITSDLPDDASGAANLLDECLNRDEAVGFHLLAVDGDVPIVLVETVEDRAMCRAHAFIVWLRDGWHVQNATVLLPSPVDDRLLGQFAAPPTTGLYPSSHFAHQMTDGDTVLLSVLAGVAICSPSPGTIPMLLALDGDSWRLAWWPTGTDPPTLNGPRSEFADATGVDRVRVTGFLWELQLDAVFHESRPGPHRYAEQIWVRDGQRYVLAEERVVPSAYNTLYNFVLRLSTGDDAGASALLADRSLLDDAKRLGLVQQPVGQEWMTRFDSRSECCGPIRIRSGPDWRGPPQPIVVTFAQRGDDWLIAGIAAE